MPSVLAENPTARLIIAGRHDDKRYEAWLQRLVQDLGLRDNVEFRFQISEAEKREILCSSRFLVLPSAVEGFGIVVLEANSSGLPVIASSGVPEGAVKDRVNGLRYQFGDIAQLSARIGELLRDDDLHWQLSNNSIAFAKRFNWAEVGHKFEAPLQKAVAGATWRGNSSHP